ncbi:type III-A CRISPR-associated RAMP protein Csm4 [Ilyomonas limi]|uniref:CRISPR system Cms protein Csm4 n=1 Tax=Ilyomonas limi TaxID=2575867 RepID=A0A4U3KU38_9BACT|nr:type III-A CRISPR-associated RAMP protein Csm4 [Ilyomonas limi]TKK65852.1 type III-A CRISPR-associated RAMP protein Csm4 [Ilyomonas limi]
MIVEVIKLHFNTPLHIGRGAIELDKTSSIYHSDALKSALYAVGLSYYQEWETMPDSFFNSFHISSLFPFCEEELFMPKPYYGIRFDFAKTTEEKQAKKAKKISFISATMFRQWMEQRDKPLAVEEAQVSPGGSYLFSHPSKTKAFLHAEVQQRVQVPSEGEDGESRPFYFDRLYFERDAGLFFLVHFHNEMIRQQVLHALAILGELGIGTDRTVGNGLFSFDTKVHISPFEFPDSSQGNFRLNLGLYLPKREEVSLINLDESYWQLNKRGGYIGGSSHEKFMSLRKDCIYFFAEGSVFKTDHALKGRYTNLRPEFNDVELHPVYRCGQPLFITI